MIYRIHRDPSPTEGGGDPSPAQAPVPVPAAATPPAEPPKAPAAATPPAVPTTVTIPTDQYSEYQFLKTRHKADLEEAERARIEAIAARDGVVRGLEEERRRAAAKLTESLDAERRTWEAKFGEATGKYAEERKTLDGRLREAQTKLEESERRLANLELLYHGTEKSRTVADALAGHRFISPAAASQARALLESRFSVKPAADGTLAVVDGQGKPAADVIKEALTSADFAHFLDPASRGGAGASGGQARPASVPADDAKKAALIDHMRTTFAPGLNRVG